MSKHSVLGLLGVLAVSGCNVERDEPFALQTPVPTPSPVPTPDPDPDPDPEPEPEPEPVCLDLVADLGSLLGTVLQGTHEADPDAVACEEPALEGWRWVAPMDGVHTFSVTGDAILSVARACEDPIRCDADGTGVTTLELTAGEELDLAVQPGATGGSWSLDIAPWTIAGDVVGPDVLTGAAGGAGALRLTCNNRSSRVDSYLWTAPQDGWWAFQTEGSTFDTVLALDDPDGAPIACDDDSGPGLSSVIHHHLLAGESVVVRVTGWSTTGINYTIGIHALADDPPAVIDCDSEYESYYVQPDLPTLPPSQSKCPLSPPVCSTWGTRLVCITESTTCSRLGNSAGPDQTFTIELNDVPDLAALQAAAAQPGGATYDLGIDTEAIIYDTVGADITSGTLTATATPCGVTLSNTTGTPSPFTPRHFRVHVP